MIKRRRRFKQTESLEARLMAEADRLRARAGKSSPGSAREQLLRKARECDTGLHMSEWLKSPGPRMRS